MRRENCAKCNESTWKVIRILAHILLFLLVITSAIISKASLFYSVKNVTQNASSTWLLTLLIIKIYPYLFEFLHSLYGLFIGKSTNKYSFKFCLVEFGFSLCECIGLFILLFRVLPYLGNIYKMVLIMNTVSIIPSLVQFFQSVKSSQKTPNSTEIDKFEKSSLILKLYHKQDIIVFLLSFILQLSFMVYISQLNEYGLNLKIKIIVSIGLISLGYLKSLFIDAIYQNGCFNQFIFSSFKIVLSIALFTIYYYNNDDLNGESIKAIFSIKEKYLLIIIIQVLTTILTYYFSLLSCKLSIQRFGFALPLVLVTPALIAICSFMEQLEYPFLLFGFLCWWISFILSNKHIFYKTRRSMVLYQNRNQYK